MKDYEALNWALERVVGPELRYLLEEFRKENIECEELVKDFEGWIVDKQVEIFNYKESIKNK